MSYRETGTLSGGVYETRKSRQLSIQVLMTDAHAAGERYPVRRKARQNRKRGLIPA